MATPLRAFLFLPSCRIEFATKRLVGRKYSFLGYTFPFEIGRHSFRLKIKKFSPDPKNCSKLFNDLIVRRVALSGLDVVKI